MPIIEIPDRPRKGVPGRLDNQRVGRLANAARRRREGQTDDEAYAPNQRCDKADGPTDYCVGGHRGRIRMSSCSC